MKEKRKHLWVTNISEILTVYEQAINIGKKRGLKEGDSISDIIIELLAKRKKANYIGKTDQDPEILKANLRENGVFPKRKKKE